MPVYGTVCPCSFHQILCSVPSRQLTSNLTISFLPVTELRPSKLDDLIALYLHHDLDYLCVARTAPCHSWRNPVEQVMSLLNLGLQCVGLMRKEMPTQYEMAIKNCNSMAEIRTVSSGPAFVDAVSESLSPCIVLLNDPFSQLKLKDEPVHCFFVASDAKFWSAVLRVDSTLKYDVSYTKANVSGQQSLLDFMDHCCQHRHYSEEDLSRYVQHVLGYISWGLHIFRWA